MDNSAAEKSTAEIHRVLLRAWGTDAHFFNHPAMSMKAAAEKFLGFQNVH